MAEFLLELLSEEIPARMQVRAKNDLQSLICKALDDAELTYGKAESFATPRRLVLAIDDLATQQPDVDVERKGPRVGAPDKAIEGFKRSLGVDGYKLTEEEDKKGAFYVARFRKVGRPTADVLAEIIPDVLANFPWPKSMRWSDHSVRWVRPLHSILCLLDRTTVALTFGPVSAGNVSRGHCFHAPEPFEVQSFEQYRKELARRYVVLDRDERRAGIKGQAELIAEQHGLRLRKDDGLLDEVTGLVEWPVAICGSIDAEFMELPPEVLVTSMRAHQKYLVLEDEAGNLAPKFIAIANLEAKDGGEAIVAGNERVLRARLWDAKFFWDQDRRRPLDEFIPRLRDMVFHAKLGTLFEKTNRIKKLAEWLAERIPDASKADAGRAAYLSKADLVSGMVGEFPELQGVMAGYYVRQSHCDQTESENVAQAVSDHYAPQGPNDDCPSAPVSVAVALADKLDTLAGFFAIDEKPTGSKDPFALRRAALGVIRLILESEVRLPLRETLTTALSPYEAQLGIENNSVINDLITFFVDRFKIHARTIGIRHDLIDAVLHGGSEEGEMDLVETMMRFEALDKFLAKPDGLDLLAAYRRASNIVQIEAKKDKIPLVKIGGKQVDYGEINQAKLQEYEEKNLFNRLIAARASIDHAMKNEDFSEAMLEISKLKSPIDSFFDAVVVNSEDKDVRKNRLSLLSKIHWALFSIADFSRIEDATSNSHNRRVA